MELAVLGGYISLQIWWRENERTKLSEFWSNAISTRGCLACGVDTVEDIFPSKFELRGILMIESATL
jgi:hypothetical protein